MIASRLRMIADGRQWSSLTTYLDGLSNAQFRTAGYILGEVILPGISSEDFWSVTTLLYNYNAKAFLVTLMKAACLRVDEFGSLPAEQLWSLMAKNEIDASKALLTLLPAMPDEVEMAQHMMNVMISNKAEKLINILLRVDTPAAAFLLLKAMRQVEHNHDLLVRTTYYLIKKGDAISFNLASLFKVYFGLDEVRGTFSLRLEPFELARLETNYEAFKKRVVSF